SAPIVHGGYSLERLLMIEEKLQRIQHAPRKVLTRLLPVGGILAEVGQGRSSFRVRRQPAVKDQEQLLHELALVRDLANELGHRPTGMLQLGVNLRGI